jgi:hypothetical protein
VVHQTKLGQSHRPLEVLVLEQAGASGGPERSTLLRQVLPLTGNAAVAQDGAGR